MARIHVLALDVATKTGWTLHTPDGLSKTCGGVQDFAGDKWDGHGMRCMRFKRWLDEVSKMVPDEDTLIVAFERPITYAGRPANNTVAQHLAAVAMLWCEERGTTTYTAPTPSECKKAATGKGNASKAAVIQAMMDRWPHYAGPPQGDKRWKHGCDEADSLAVLVWVLETELDPPT